MQFDIIMKTNDYLKSISYWRIITHGPDRYVLHFAISEYQPACTP